MREVSKNISISRLLVRHLKGELNPSEKQELDDLFKEDPELYNLYQKYKDPVYLEKELNRHFSIDLDQKWNMHRHLSRKLTIKRKMILIAKIAAALLIPAFVTFYLIFNPSEEIIDTKQVFASKSLPGSSKAQLVIENGEIFELDETQDLSIRDSVIQIKSRKSELVYKTTSQHLALKPKEHYHTLIVPRGGEFDLTLSDGTKIWVNSQSRIKYPKNFVADIRMIELIEGEAYFEVAHDADRPFIVNTKEGLVKVLGTSFNIRAYSDEAASYTTLVDGSISLRHKHAEESEVILEPGQQGVLIDVNHKIRINEVDIELVIAWKDGNFIFASNRMEDILNRLSRWYDFEVQYENEELKNMMFRGNLDRKEGVVQILDLFEKTKRIQFEYTENKILVKSIKK